MAAFKQYYIKKPMILFFSFVSEFSDLNTLILPTLSQSQVFEMCVCARARVGVCVCVFTDPMVYDGVHTQLFTHSLGQAEAPPRPLLSGCALFSCSFFHQIIKNVVATPPPLLIQPPFPIGLALFDAALLRKKCLVDDKKHGPAAAAAG